MPEYGRNVQKMVDYVKTLPDKEKRSEQARAVVGVMGILNPQLRDMNDFKHKLWDHVHVISNFSLDIEAPYAVPEVEALKSRPQKIELDAKALKINYYGRHIQNMAEALAQKPQNEERDEMVKALAYYMRKQYLIWNKDAVSDQTIFADMKNLTEGRLQVPDGFKMDEVQGEQVRQSYYQSKNGQQKGGLNPNGHAAARNNNKKRRKKQY